MAVKYDSFEDLINKNKTLINFMDASIGKGMIKAVWESRQTEIDELNEKIEKLIEEHQLMVTALSVECDREVIKIKGIHAEEMQSFERKIHLQDENHSETVSDIKRQHQNEMAMMAKKYEDQLRDSVSEYKEICEKRIQRVLDNADEQLKQCRNDNDNRFAILKESFEHKLQLMHSNHRAQVGHLEAEKDELNKELLRLGKALENVHNSIGSIKSELAGSAKLPERSLRDTIGVRANQ